MLQTIFIYISLIIIVTSLTQKSAKLYSNNKKHWSNFYLLIAIIIFSIIFGMRYYVGIDYENYLNIYEQADYRMLRYEPTFLLLTLFCQSQDYHFAIYFGLIAFIQILFLFLAFRERRYLLPFIFSFLMLSGDIMVGWMNVMRHYIAISLFVFATSILSKRNLKSIILYYVLISLAISFHYSSLLLLFIPIFLIRKSWFNNIKIQCGVVIVFFLFQLIGSNFIAHILEPIAQVADYEEYLDNINLDGSRIGIVNIITLFLYIFIILNSKIVKTYYQKDHYFPIVYDLAIIGILLDYLFAGSMMLTRLNICFSIFKYPLFAYYTYYYYTNRSWGKNKLKYHAISLYFIILFTRVMMTMTENTSQYVFYFQEELCKEKEEQCYNRKKLEVN